MNASWSSAPTPITAPPDDLADLRERLAALDAMWAESLRRLVAAGLVCQAVADEAAACRAARS